MRLTLDEVMAEKSKPRYERVVSCKHCEEPGLMFDTSKTGNPWLYSVTELLTPEQVEELRENSRYNQFLREIVLGRDEEGKLGTGFVLILKHKPHRACQLETRLALESKDEVGQTGTIDVTETETGIPMHVDDQPQDESITTGYDGNAEVEGVDDEYGLAEYKVVED